jgi:hypothetical protein
MFNIDQPVVYCDTIAYITDISLDDRLTLDLGRFGSVSNVHPDRVVVIA